MSSPSGGAWLSQSDTTRLPSFLTVAAFWRMGATLSASRDGLGIAKGAMLAKEFDTRRGQG
jgi:hypothetical protein